jgi:hypothetical protein
MKKQSGRGQPLFSRQQGGVISSISLTKNISQSVTAFLIHGKLLSIWIAEGRIYE